MSAPDMLREAIELQGVSQAWLARQTGLSNKHVNQVIMGRVPFSVDVALRIECAMPTLSAEDLMIAQVRTQVREARMRDA